MATNNLNMSKGIWLGVADGAGYATVEAKTKSFNYFITPDSSYPTEAFGISNAAGEPVSMKLETGERLWLLGDGKVTVIADVPV